MKKILRIITATSFLFMLGNVNAQIDGLTNNAPDFTEYDINGIEYSLYEDYLDKGIPVVIDVMAYWCPPCWSYSTGGALECLWEEHGFSATGDSTVMVFMVDGDAACTMDHLRGGAGSQGDWLSITNYPVFGGDSGLGSNSGATIGNLYQINYFPTVFLIHPDRTVEEIGQSTCNTFSSAIQNVNQVSNNVNDLNLKYGYSLPSSCPGGSISFDFIMKNQGNSTMTSAQLDVEVDGNVIHTMDWTGSLEAYELSEETVTFTLDGIETGDYDLNLVVKKVNGMDDEDASNNTITRALNLKETENRYYRLTVRTDANGNETNWFIRNSNDEIVYRRNDFNDGPYGNNESNEHIIDLKEADCYKLRATDSDGDGMTGYIILKDYDNQTIGYFSVEGDESEISWESKTVLAVSDIENGYVSVFPNPVNDVLNINYSLGTSSEVSYQLVNILGQNIESKKLGFISGTQNIQINTADLEEGVYLLSITLGDEKITERIIK